MLPSLSAGWLALAGGVAGAVLALAAVLAWRFLGARRRAVAVRAGLALENHYRSLANRSGTPVMIRRDGRMLFANSAWAALHGFSAPADLEQAGGLAAITKPEELARARVEEARVLRTGHTLRRPARHLRRDRGDLTLELVESPILWEGRRAVLAATGEVPERARVETALAEIQSRFQSVVEGSLQGILIRRGLKILFVNRVWALIHGLGSPQEAIALGTVEPFLTPEAAQLLQESDAELLRTREPFQEIVHRLRRDGSPMVMEQSKRVVDWEGEPAILVATIDITERFRSEVALRESEQRFRGLVEGSIQGILVRRGETPLFVNRAFAHLHGYPSPEAILALPSLRVLMSPEDWGHLQETDQEVMRTGQPRQERGRRIRADGSEIWVELTRQPVMWDGEPTMQVVMIDVTQQHRAGEALRESEQRFRRLIEESPHGMHIHRSGRSLYVNSAFASMYGYDSPEEFLRMGDWQAHVPPEERAASRAAEEAVQLGAERGLRGQARRVRKDGTRIWVETFRTRIVWEGQPAVLSTLNDITDRYEAERALRASEERFRRLIEEAPQAMHIRRDGRSLYVNPSFVRIYGHASSAEFLALEERLSNVPLEQRGQTALEDAEIISGKRQIFHEEVPRQRGDGGMIWVETFRRRVDWEGQPAVLATSIDITERRKAQESVRESEQRLRTMFETIPVPIAITDAEDGRFLLVNTPLEQITGLPVRQLLLRRGADFYADKDDLRDVDRIIKRDGTVAPRETRFRRADGSEYWALMSARMFMHEGRPAVLTVLNDLSERKAIEAALRESEQRLRAIFETIPVPVGIVRKADARFVLVNPRMEQALGLPAEELYRRNNLEFYVKSRDAERVVHTLEQRGELTAQEFQMRRADGSLMWALIAARNFLYQGEPAVLAAMNDVTDLRVMEQALQESREHLRTVVNNAPLILLAVDASGVVSLLEGKPLAQLKLNPDRIVNRTAAEAFESIPQLIADLRAAGLGRAFRSIVESGNSVFEFWYQPLLDAEGRVSQVIGVGTDITELKSREQALIQAQKMEAVGQLTGGVAHDFNNLLTIIVGNTELLELAISGQDPEALRQVELIRNAATRGSELTQRLLAFSRRQPLQPRPVEMERFLSDLAALLKRTLGERIALRTSCPPQAWQPVVDQGQLANAIINLAVNARDAMPHGGELTIEAEHLPRERTAGEGLELAPGDYVVLKVADAGTGMEPDVMRRAFDPFFTTKAVGKGSGLGLSMVYGFVQQSGGQVKIESELGRGTTVRLYLPRALAKEKPRTDPAPAAAAQSKGTERILVVEDDSGVREFAVRFLRGLGYTVSAAETGQEALALLEQEPAPDLLFSDIILPGNMTGEELAAKVRVRMPSIKVLFTSGYTSDHLLRDGRLPEGVNLLDKPYKSHQLAATVRRVLDQRP